MRFPTQCEFAEMMLEIRKALVLSYYDNEMNYRVDSVRNRHWEADSLYFVSDWTSHDSSLTVLTAFFVPLTPNISTCTNREPEERMAYL